MTLILPQRGRIRQAAGGASGPIITQTATSVIKSQSSSETHSTLSIGSAPTGSDRRFVVAAITSTRVTNTNRSLSVFTIGGTTPTYVATGASSGEQTHAIGWREINTGTTTDVVQSITGGVAEIWTCVLYTIVTTGAAVSITDWDESVESTSTTNNMTFDIVEDGLVVICGGTDDGTNGGTPSASSGGSALTTVLAAELDWNGTYPNNQYLHAYKVATTTAAAETQTITWTAGLDSGASIGCCIS